MFLQNPTWSDPFIRPSNDSVDIHHLHSLDPVLARSIDTLKRDTNDVARMELDFSICINSFDDHQVVPYVITVFN